MGEKAAVGAGIGIAAALALLLARKPTGVIAQEGGLVLDEATAQLLSALVSASDATANQLAEITSLLRGLSISVQGFVPNADSIRAGRVLITAANTAIQLPDIVVPDDMPLQIKGWPTNGGIIYVSDSRSGSVNINQSWPLLANEAIGYRVKNANVLWVSGTVAGEWAAFTVERRS